MKKIVDLLAVIGIDEHLNQLVLVILLLALVGLSLFNFFILLKEKKGILTFK